MTTVDWVIFDLDGLVRDWGNNELEDAELAAGIEPGTILSCAFGPELGQDSITGALSYEAWQDRIAAELIPLHGEQVIPILTEWRDHRGTINPDMLDLERQIRRQLPTALLTNGSTRLEEDLEVLGLTDEWDHVFSTSRLGVAKPNPGAFHTVLERLGVPAHRAAFIDDHPANVDSAQQVGLIAHLHTDIATTAAFLATLGLPTTYSSAHQPLADSASDALDQRNPVS